MVHWRSPGGEWSQPADQSSAGRSGAGLGLTLEHPLFMYTKSAPFLGGAEGSPCQVPKPGAHDGFLAEGPVRPRLQLLLVPTSWDTTTLEPAHAHRSPCLLALKAAHLQLPLAGSWGLSSPWFPGFLICSTQDAPSPFPRRGCCHYSAEILLLLLVGNLTWQGNCPKHTGFSPKNKPFLYTSLQRAEQAIA